jgi:hypothetical protein
VHPASNKNGSQRSPRTKLDSNPVRHGPLAQVPGEKFFIRWIEIFLEAATVPDLEPFLCKSILSRYRRPPGRHAEQVGEVIRSNEFWPMEDTTHTEKRMVDEGHRDSAKCGEGSGCPIFERVTNLPTDGINLRMLHGAAKGNSCQPGGSPQVLRETLLILPLPPPPE